VRGILGLVVWSSACASLPLLAVVLLLEGPAQLARTLMTLSALQWLGVLFQAGPTILLAFTLWAWLIRLYPASLIAPFSLLVPVVGMSCAVLLLGEAVTWWKLTGASLVMAGLATNVLAFRRPAQPAGNAVHPR
jgi:O-acetylserine/cysteine efflux transporter